MQKDSLYVQAIRKFSGQQPTISAPADPAPLPQEPWQLDLAGVSFAYPGGAPILNDISLSIRPREKNRHRRP